MKKQLAVAMFVTLLVTTSLAAMISPVALAADASTGPIRIDSNADLITQAASNGWAGDGSESDPFIISGLTIDATGYGDAIFIGNTTYHIVIENCTLSHGEWIWDICSVGAVINIYYSSNVVVKDNTISDATFGIYLWGSSNVTISNNNIKPFNIGICCQHDSSGITVSNNTISGANEGIRVVESYNNDFIDNVISSTYAGIYMPVSNFNEISGNTINGAFFGIYLQSSSSDTVSTNAISGANEGIRLEWSNNNPILNNDIQDSCTAGISLFYSSNNIISSNTISTVSYCIEIDSGTANVIYQNSLDNINHFHARDNGYNTWNYNGFGNSWSDWLGPDTDHNGIVDLPRAIDGGSNFDYLPIASEVYIAPPTVLSISPADGVMDADVETSVQITFSSAMNRASVENAFSLSSGWKNVSGEFFWINDSALSFIPSAPLLNGADYNISIGLGAMSLDGTLMASTFISGFLTAERLDSAEPVISTAAPSFIALHILGTSALQTFGASYTDNVGVVSAAVTLDGIDVTNAWGVDVSGFSRVASLAIGQHTIELAVKDAAGNTAIRTWNVDVVQDTVPPAITSLNVPIEPIVVNAQVSASAVFTDLNPGDTHTAVWSWDDGTTSQGIIGESDETVTGSHTYMSPGVYTVSVTVTDSSGLSDSAVAQTYVVVYDPAGGFVTGGGWINSPSGSYRADSSLEGKATFGFVAKYQNGANIPSGNTEFQFSVGNLNFHSSSYEWLVVNQGGTNAQFKGDGTINGATAPNGQNYHFMIWAGDHSPDTFRIKIWWEDAAGEHVVYDNGVQQAIAGGSIVVHTK